MNTYTIRYEVLEGRTVRETGTMEVRASYPGEAIRIVHSVKGSSFFTLNAWFVR